MNFRISKKGTAAGSVKQFLLKRFGLQKEYLRAEGRPEAISP